MPGSSRCVARIARLNSFAPFWYRGRCWGTRRPAQTVAEELRDYGVKWRAITFQVIDRTSDPWELQDAGARQVDYRLDEDLMTLGLELTQKLCRGCAEVKARAWLWTRKLVFIGVLAAATGRDERAQEEFNLGAAA